MRKIFLDIGPTVVFQVKVRLVMQILRKPARAFLYPKLDLLEDLGIGLDGLLGL